MSEEKEQTIGDDFLLELFKLSMHDTQVLDVTINNLKTNWLTTEQQKKFFTELKFQYTAESKKPTYGTLKVALRKERKVIEYINIFQQLQVPDVATTLKTLEQFIKDSMFVEMYDESAAFFNRGDKRKAFEAYTKGSERFMNFSLTNNMFEPVFGHFTKRHTERVLENSLRSDKLPTGIDQLDHILRGGPERKEFMMFLAESKGTKSYALRHLGVNYARRGFGAAHFQLEGTRKQCLTGYDSAWTGALYHDIKGGEVDERIFKSHQKIVENIGRGEIEVFAPERFNSMTVGELRQMVLDLKKKRKIDVVLVDYLDLLMPDNERYSPNDERLKQRKVSRLLKDLAVELDVLMVTATQASSISSEFLKDPDFVIRREHLGEDKGKVQPVDYLFSINRTPDERNEGTARIFIDAAREYHSDDIIYIYQNLARGRFYDRKRTLAEFGGTE